MKFYLVIVCCLFYDTVNSVKHLQKNNKTKEIYTLKVDFEGNDKEGSYEARGERFQIRCTAQSKNQKVDWYYPDGTVVGSNQTQRVYVIPPKLGRSPQFNYDLVITKLDIQDTGLWSCKSANTNLEETVRLCVIDPVEFFDVNEHVTVNQGRAVSLSCKTRGEPEPIFEWFRNGEPIMDDPEEKYMTGYKYNHDSLETFLTITAVRAADADVYSCVATQKSWLQDGCSNVDRFNIRLNVNHRPEFLIGSENDYYFMNISESVQLICEASAYPPPEYSWWVGDVDEDLLKEIPEGETVEKDSISTLNVTFDEDVYGKRYKCEATNEYGTDVKNFFIYKVLKPLKPNNIYVVEESWNSIKFNITWDDDKPLFPVSSLQVEYFEKTESFTPRERNWRESNYIVLEKDDFDFYSVEHGIIFSLTKLDGNKEYWVRLSVVNGAGQSAWSAAVLAATAASSVLKELLIGLAFSAVIVLFGGACILVVKRL